MDRRLAGAVAVSFAVLLGCYPDVDPTRASVNSQKPTKSCGCPDDETGGGGAPSAPPQEPAGGDPGEGAAGAGPGPSVDIHAECAVATSSEPLPARAAVMSNEVETGDRLYFTVDLFNTFKSYCGGCHVESYRVGAFGDQPVTLKNFSTLVDQSALDVIKTNDDALLMPPPESGGKKWDERSEDDPVREFVGRMELWIQAGRPADSFQLPAAPGTEDRPYLFSTELGQTLTNIGNCIPSKAIFAIESKKSVELDEKFEAIESFADLPTQLEETDLFTFDSAELATYGVIGFAPAYPLWSDDAGKIRFVRVPRGKSIHYDAETHEFQIPDNTRFYKTFLKEVVDSEGSKSFRKIETRLILARADDCSKTPCEVKALMATYAWDEEESKARLVTEPMRNGDPFLDQVFNYTTDEPKMAELRAQGVTTPEGLRVATRHYAIPGSDRCVQCHLGSASQSGILGFTPIQVQRWPFVTEPDMAAPPSELKGFGILRDNAPLGDELTQLARLIDYGVVTGLDSPDDVVSLKDSQKAAPRNGYELQAQGYMLGNCANCHNPRGYPTLRNPELGPMLDFYPDKNGGVFRFPLDRFSPRMKRGQDRAGGPNPAGRIPYITPSLFDYRYKGGTDNANSVGAYKKHYAKDVSFIPVPAPWRSFIYRNVDTPFTYSDDFAIFPHMPLNAPGFDCRARRIMGNWMLSIPARIKGPLPAKATDIPLAENEEEQPYTEVEPSDEGYDAAVQAARTRTQAFQRNWRYDQCPDTSDIQAPEVLAGEATPRADGFDPPGTIPGLARFSGNVPDRSHWVVSDLTEVPGDWSPRRPDWADVLGSAPDPAKLAALDEEERRVVEIFKTDTIRLGDELRQYATRPIPYGFWQERGECREALDEVPTLLSLLEATPPLIPPDFAARAPFTTEDPRLTRDDLDRPAYFASPGAAVFNAICGNCHGPLANGDSANANTILTITGGSTRVANLKDGILGPLGGPGSARQLVFADEAAKLGIGTDDLASRYMAWMGLGGTQREIPRSVIDVIGNADVLGVPRQAHPATVSPNMLEVARLLCMSVVNDPSINFDLDRFHVLHGPNNRSALVPENGDMGMWQRLCAQGREPPIFMIEPPGTGAENWDTSKPFQFVVPKLDSGQVGEGGINLRVPAIFKASVLGASPVITLAQATFEPGASPQGGDQPVFRRAVIRAANSLHALSEPIAWCLRRPQLADFFGNEAAFQESLAKAEQFVTELGIDGQPLPFCPEPFSMTGPAQNLWNLDELQRWELRGAMNAGLAVFSYLDEVAKGVQPRALQYNECQNLQ